MSYYGPYGPAGDPGVNWTGAWSSATAYHIRDGVTRLGQSYVCLVPNTNIDPDTDVSGKWLLLAAKGAAGTNGLVTNIEDEGVGVTTRATWNFAGAGVTVTDTGTKNLITIPGGGGGSSLRQAVDYDPCNVSSLPTGFSSTGQLTYNSTKIRRELGGTSTSTYQTPVQVSDTTPWWDISASILGPLTDGTVTIAIMRGATELCRVGLQSDGNMVLYDSPSSVLFASGGGQLPRYEIINWKIGFDVERNIFWSRIARDGGNSMWNVQGRQPPNQGIATAQNLSLLITANGTQKCAIYQVMMSPGIPVLE